MWIRPRKLNEKFQHSKTIILTAKVTKFLEISFLDAYSSNISIWKNTSHLCWHNNSVILKFPYYFCIYFHFHSSWEKRATIKLDALKGNILSARELFSLILGGLVLRAHFLFLTCERFRERRGGIGESKQFELEEFKKKMGTVEARHVCVNAL